MTILIYIRLILKIFETETKVEGLTYEG